MFSYIIFYTIYDYLRLLLNMNNYYKINIISYFVTFLLNQAVISAPGPASWNGYPHF